MRITENKHHLILTSNNPWIKSWQRTKRSMKDTFLNKTLRKSISPNLTCYQISALSNTVWKMKFSSTGKVVSFDCYWIYIYIYILRLRQLKDCCEVTEEEKERKKQKPTCTHNHVCICETRYKNLLEFILAAMTIRKKNESIVTMESI